MRFIVVTAGFWTIFLMVMFAIYYEVINIVFGMCLVIFSSLTVIRVVGEGEEDE